MKANKLSQSFSTDIVVVIVVVLFGALFLVMNQTNNINNGSNLNKVYKQSTDDSKLVVENLKENDIITSKKTVNLNRLLQMKESSMKEQLGIKDDFAIVFEKDGKLVKIDPDKNINCIGSPNIIVNGQKCVS